MYTLRPYQAQAVSSIWEHVYNEHGNPVVVLPTGTGKSIVIAQFIHEVQQKWSNIRILMLTHVGELVKQNYEKLKAIAPELELGIYSASLNEYDTSSSVIFATIQSVYSLLKRDSQAFGKVNVIIVDECHLIAEAQTSMYRSVFEHFSSIHSRLKIIGFSATPFRAKGGYIYGENKLFSRACIDFSLKMTELIDQGYLSDVRTLKTQEFIDTKGIKTVLGDFSQKELNARIGQDLYFLAKAISQAKAIAQKYGKKHWLVFTSGIENVEKINNLLNSLEICSKAVHSKKSKDENDTAIQLFRDNKITALVSADQLTTGFDVPQADLLVMLRPTKSVSLWVQIVGRVMRVAPNKDYALVLDFARNLERLGPVNAPIIKTKDSKDSKSPKERATVKECKECSMYIPITSRTCPYCGYTFTHQDELHLGFGDILERTFKTPAQDGCRIATVLNVTYEKFKSKNNNEFFTAKYTTVFKGKKRTMRIWFFGQNSCWHELKGHSPEPRTIDEYISRSSELNIPLGLEFVPKNFFKNILFDRVIRPVWE